ncbi:MAG: 5'-nucleotidase SurE [Chlamydiales bacterium]|nr:5'-nucleotidase SurE [Chlamydiales bacterium]
MNRPKIVLTNDDGIEAPGIKALWRALHKADFADLFIIAPSVERSGTGVSITWDRPILIQEIEWEENTPSWSVDGTPADCIKMGERVILGYKPDFIVSGVNIGSNAGRNVLHSGTVGACVEGVFRNIPGIAFSCEDFETPNFHVAERHIAQLVQYVLANPLPPGCFLNVNFPRTAQEDVEGFCLTRQGKGRWAENPYLHLDGEHGQSYWLGGKPEEIDEEADCDIAWLKKGYMTAVPIHVHELTEKSELAKRQKSFEQLFTEKKLSEIPQ